MIAAENLDTSTTVIVGLKANWTKVGFSSFFYDVIIISLKLLDDNKSFPLVLIFHSLTSAVNALLQLQGKM